MKGRHLITTDAWFYAPDGKKYRAVYGDVEIVEDTFLGIKTNRGSTNWYAKVGSDKEYVIIAGCQIHYAIRTDTPPSISEVVDVSYGENGIREFNRPTEIYMPELF